jgi:hypothetical protein
MDNHLDFSQHVTNLAAKCHQTANLILKCFRSGDATCLVMAFKTYVRPRLEYCSSAWNPTLIKNIEILEKVQRRFTKRIPKMKHLTYHQRLTKLQLESLELRRIRADLILTYKLVFGLLDVEVSDFFILRTRSITRGHQYRLSLPTCSSSTRQNFFTYRVIKIWNSLPLDSTDFSSLHRFKNSLTSNVLVRHCKVYFF